jgi:hypothetical protein
VGLTLRIEKQLTKNIQHSTAQPGGITSIVETDALFALSIDKLPMKVAAGRRLSIMTAPRTPTVK